MSKKKISDANKILDRMDGEDPELQAEVEQQILNARIARILFDARKRAGLSQQQLAERAGTTQARISRLEDADYRGHTLLMLQRLARVLDFSLELRVNPEGTDPLAV